MSKPLRVLIIEDSAEDAALLIRELQRGGYDLTSARVETPAAMGAALDQQPWDLVIADHSMPHFNALAALKVLVDKGLDMPFIIVSGTISDDVIVAAMRSGAHDYISKDATARLVLAIERELHEVEERRGRRCAEEQLKLSLERERKALEQTIASLAAAVDKRDPYTAGHQERVSRLACAIGGEMGLSGNQIEGIRVVGCLHDIGKIHIPSDILSKPGRLTEAEMSLIRAHPKIGYDILKGIEFPRPVAQIVLQHHERMNGSGYPLGLSGQSILLEARILGVADVVEAMCSHRPYRPALSVDKTLEEISQKRNGNGLYDPNAAKACVSLLAEKGFRFERTTVAEAEPGNRGGEAAKEPTLRS